MPTILNQELITAPDDEQRGLAEAEQLLEHRGTAGAQPRPKLVGPEGLEVELPEALLQVLRQAVQHLRRGDSVAVEPIHRELTTQQAADLLNVSRPYLVRLLEEGRIPYTKTGTHRRVRLEDVLAYKRQRDTERREALARLTQLSQELGLNSEHELPDD